MPVLTVSSTADLETVPLVVEEQRLTFFKFCMDQSIHEGMAYGNELYRLARQFIADDQLGAHRCGCELIGQGVPALISVSKQGYAVWMRLRSPLANSCTAS